jgi:hypothetical protein
MNPIPVFARHTSPRLGYILDWLFVERLGVGYRLVADQAEAETLPFCISYGTKLRTTNNLYIPDQQLLWEPLRHFGHTKQGASHGSSEEKRTGGARPSALNLQSGSWAGLPVIFAVPEATGVQPPTPNQSASASAQQATSGESQPALPFDLFSALFFLLSRYEEYLPYRPDKHGRYPATESFLYKTGNLERPLADEWVQAFRNLLQQTFQIQLPEKAFVFLPTYDIDIAWSYKYKGGKRTAGAMLRDLVRGNLGAIGQRLSVLSGRQKDPFDAFGDMQSWHREYALHPYYFILSARETSAFDKNISSQHPAMQHLVRQLSKDGGIGIHPSYYSDRYPERLTAEKATLEALLSSRKKITQSRQHYIKLKIPDTFRTLIRAGITDDFSMGYGTHLGFRAGTGQPFLWYDLERETVTPLRIHPFCFMDTTARYDARLTAPQAFSKLDEMTQRLQATQSRLVTVFHNFSLGSDAGWKGWKDAYLHFISRMAR